MGTLHAMAAIHRHTESCCLEVIATPQSSIGIGAIAVENVHGIVALSLLGVFNQPGGQTIVIGRSIILGADTDRIFISVVVRTDETNIHRDIFGHPCGNIGTAQADLDRKSVV